MCVLDHEMCCFYLRCITKSHLVARLSLDPLREFPMLPKPHTYSVSQKNPPEDFWQFFQNG